ncbi:hypothetical protein M3O96_20610 [Aquiflexum sp. TKW24L]|uniref:hypothetical protein n=1 Tax=Aquiflexum sp. TKW24L TaxID=2942212 RepID=UPI0020BED262|nr:hypothetical protein [Aquiflexum sp. TKW24L]MCL6261514.1 hypothetical protein [Aquiflexum sp. TKW24L]
MNRFFVSFAAIASSGIFAYSYWREWISYKLLGEELVLQPVEKAEVPYFHASEELYLRVLMSFGLLFSLILIVSIYFTYRQKWGWVFGCFVLSMLSILAVMINGALK